jgi:hypothetical protein
MKHSEILRALQRFEGYPNIKEWQLRSIRKSLNLIYRRPDKISSTEYEQASTLIRNDLEASLITQWGYRSVQNHLRIAHNLFADQRTVNAILRDLDPVRSSLMMKMRLKTMLTPLDLETTESIMSPEVDLTKILCSLFIYPQFIYGQCIYGWCHSNLNPFVWGLHEN